MIISFIIHCLIISITKSYLQDCMVSFRQKCALLHVFSLLQYILVSGRGLSPCCYGIGMRFNAPLPVFVEGRSHRGKVGNYYNSCNIARNQMMSIKHLVMMELYGALQTEVRPSAWILPSTTYFGVRKRFYRPVTMALGGGLLRPFACICGRKITSGKSWDLLQFLDHC